MIELCLRFLDFKFNGVYYIVLWSDIPKLNGPIDMVFWGTFSNIWPNNVNEFSVCRESLSRSLSRNSLKENCMQPQQHCLLIDFNDFFYENFVLTFWGQKGWALLIFFNFYKILTLRTFLIFCMKLQQHKGLDC